MPKRIAFCANGTWCHPQAPALVEDQDTNFYRLYRSDTATQATADDDDDVEDDHYSTVTHVYERNGAIGESAPPDRKGLAGTRLVHYGPLWDPKLEDASEGEQGPVAVLVCHGMGQQVKFETISSVAQALRTEAEARGNITRDVEVHISKQDDGFLTRAEIGWIDGQKREHSVHIYEAYWAPLTEGRVTYRDTLGFLFSAGWQGLRYSLRNSGTFSRWMFGRLRDMMIDRGTPFAIFALMIFLLAQVVVIGFVVLELTQMSKVVVAQPLPVMSLHPFWQGLGQLIRDLFRWLSPFFPEYSNLRDAAAFSRAWYWSLGKLIGWFALIAEALFVRRFLIQYVGDVAAYISPYKDSKFDELRQKIQKVGLDVGKIVYGFGPPNVTVPLYRKIVVVGHSLGSVIAYDTLNALINLDNTSDHSDRRGVVERTRALITFGSPLDKTAFIFRVQAKDPQSWIREQCAAGMQPLIVDYARYRRAPFKWLNIWSPQDIISGELDYYDDPALSSNDPFRIKNEKDEDANIPLAAHVQYWGNSLLRKRLYEFVS